MSSGHGNRAILAALAANLGIAITKFIAWLLTRSSSMLAEAIHSLADSSNQFMMLLGSKRSGRKADDLHPFGYGRTRYVTAFLVSIVLFSVGGLFALYEAYHKFAHPEAITEWKWVPIAVLVVSIAMEGRSFMVALHEANRVRGTMSLMKYVRSSRSPEIPVILTEDFAALIGLFFALAGVSLTLATGDGRWDAVGSGTIGVLLVIVAFFLAYEVGSMLIGESATPQVQEKIRQALSEAREDGVQEILSLRTLHTAPETVLIACRFAIDSEATGAEIASAINRTEERIRAAVDLECLIFLEPDLRADTKTH